MDNVVFIFLSWKLW